MSRTAGHYWNSVNQLSQEQRARLSEKEWQRRELCHAEDELQ